MNHYEHPYDRYGRVHGRKPKDMPWWIEGPLTAIYIVGIITFFWMVGVVLEGMTYGR